MNKQRFLVCLFAVIAIVSLLPNNFHQSIKPVFSISSQASEQQFKIKQKNPVVNEKNKIMLTTVDKDGVTISNGITWESGNTDVAKVNPSTGEVFGEKTGFATVTARRGSETFSVFVTVVRVKKGNGANVPGDTKTDTQGGIYISSPLQNVIFKASGELNSPLKPYAGKDKIAGNKNGRLEEALFAGPTAIGIDNSANGGLYVADTLNHSVRKIGFNKEVQTIIGKGSPGATLFSSEGVDFDQVSLSSPRGAVSDVGGNLFIADTDNHSIYYIDMAKRKAFLLAGEPGQKGSTDGVGQSARFNRPSGMALSNDGRLLTVADQDNNRIRLIEISRNADGVLASNVSSLGSASSTLGIAKNSLTTNEPIKFDQPQSVSLDSLGNIYVIDKTGAQLVTRTQGQLTEIVSLAQQDVTFNQAVSLTVKGSEVFVLDNGAIDSEALKIVSVGAPEIVSVDPPTLILNENREITLRGKSFSPETQLVFDGKVLKDVNVISAEEIRFRVPLQETPGKITLSVLSRGGLAQRQVDVVGKTIDSLAIGEITTVAGGRISFGDGGQAGQGTLLIPSKTVFDSNGNLFIADLRTIRRVDVQTNIITTVAGGGNELKDGVLATTAQFFTNTIAVDKAGNVFFADSSTKRVRRVDSLTNIVTTVAGQDGKKFSGDGGLAIEAGIDGINDITFDNNGNLLILEPTRLRQIDSNGIIRTIAGTGRNAFDGDGGLATNASLGDVTALDVDQNGNIFIAQQNGNRIRKIDSKGVITTIAGSGKKIVIGRDNLAPDREGKLATKAKLLSPQGVTLAPNNKLFIVDFGVINEFRPNSFSFEGIISQIDLSTNKISRTKINLTKLPSFAEDLSINGKLSVDGLGNLFFSTFGLVYRLDLTTGNAIPIVGGNKINSSEEGTPAQTASLTALSSITFDSNNNLYLADSLNGQVRKVEAATNKIFTIVGKTPTTSPDKGDGGLATNALCIPVAIAVDSSDNLLIADSGFEQKVSSQIRSVNLKTGIITSIAGSRGKDTDSGDNGPATNAEIGSIRNLTVDSKNNIYILSRFGNLRKIDAKTKIITTLANNAADGAFTSLSVDTSGNILLSSRNIIKKFDPITGKSSILAGKPTSNFAEIAGDGGQFSQALLGSIIGVQVDKSGNMFIGADGFESNSTNILSLVRQVDAKTNIINTIAGNKNSSSDAETYKGDGDLATKASLAVRPEIVLDKKGNLYIFSNVGSISSVRMVKLAQ